MQIEVFRSFSNELKDLWLDLEQSVQPFIFQRWNWILNWYQTIGQENQTKPYIVVIKEGEIMLGILPFGMSIKKGVRVFSPMGGNQSDYHCPILTEYGKTLLENKGNWLKILDQLPNYDLLHWDKLPLSTPIKVLLQVEGLTRQNIQYAYAADLPGTWEEFQLGLTSRIRSDSRRQRRRLAEKGDLCFEIIESNSVIEYNTFFSQKRGRFRTTGVIDMLSSDSSRCFYNKMPKKVSDNALIHFAVLKLDEEILATHWGAIDEGRFYYLMPTFNQDWNRFSPGRLLLEHLIEWSIENNLRVFDFTIGGEDYKKVWCNRETLLYDILQARSLKGVLYIKLLNLKQKLRESGTLVQLIRKLRRWNNILEIN